MNIGLSILIIILFVCIVLIMRIYFMKKSIKEIEVLLNDILESDTNNLITISSADNNIKNLANSLNTGLKKIRNQKLQYESGNQKLKNIIANISHDLRTPLTAIKGYIDLMKDDKLSENQERYLKIINKKSDELVGLTNQLFDFSKTIDIDIKMDMENCCINEILEETLVSYYTVFKEKTIVPEILICKEKVYRTVNKVSIVRIFENILSNVTKYSNGSFKIELQNDGKITFSNKANSLDATTVQKIFDRYFTVENAKKSTGLGLSIAKQLVELNNGNICADYKKDILIIEIKFN